MVSSNVSSRSREGFRRPSDREDIVYRDRGQLGLGKTIYSVSLSVSLLGLPDVSVACPKDELARLKPVRISLSIFVDPPVSRMISTPFLCTPTLYLSAPAQPSIISYVEIWQVKRSQRPPAPLSILFFNSFPSSASVKLVPIKFSMNEPSMV